jgi:hypothetical protein
MIMHVLVSTLLVLGGLAVTAWMVGIALRLDYASSMNDWHITVPGLGFPLLVFIAAVNSYPHYRVATCVYCVIAACGYAAIWAIFAQKQATYDARQARARQEASSTD